MAPFLFRFKPSWHHSSFCSLYPSVLASLCLTKSLLAPRITLQRSFKEAHLYFFYLISTFFLLGSSPQSKSFGAFAQCSGKAHSLYGWCVSLKKGGVDIVWVSLCHADLWDLFCCGCFHCFIFIACWIFMWVNRIAHLWDPLGDMVERVHFWYPVCLVVVFSMTLALRDSCLTLLR